MRRTSGVFGLMVALLSQPAHAITCTVGQPCGATCISVNDTCHVGAGGGGGLDGDGAAGLVLMGAGAIMELSALLSSERVGNACAPVSPDALCWPRFAQYSAYAVGGGLIIAGFVMFLTSKTGTSGAGLSPAGLSVVVPF